MILYVSLIIKVKQIHILHTYTKNVHFIDAIKTA